MYVPAEQYSTKNLRSVLQMETSEPFMYGLVDVEGSVVLRTKTWFETSRVVPTEGQRFPLKETF